ncbi:CUB domain-containing protein 1 [Engraulis encrasicolus]|uniref:CUB domain-containing protein 1 n=1 Tax=Engraulis encrasicolus TaxID=184585 RepID=UPI002FD62756
MRYFCVVWIEVLLLGLVLTPATVMSEGVTVTMTPDAGSTVTISKDPAAPGCEACVEDGETPPAAACGLMEYVLSKPVETTIKFNCSQPQDVYKVQTDSKIECTSDACTPGAASVQSTLFQEFQRSFRWVITGPEGRPLGLDIPAGDGGGGLALAPEANTCENGYLYSVSTGDGPSDIPRTLTYCRGGEGNVTHLDVDSMTSVTVDVPKQGTIDATVFTVAPIAVATTTTKPTPAPTPKPTPAPTPAPVPKPPPKKGRTMSVTPDPSSQVFISKTTEGVASDCQVCVGAEPNPTCTNEVTLNEPQDTAVKFTCDNPEDIFKVEIIWDFDFTEDSSSKEMTAASSLFLGFERTFAWDMKVPPSRTFQMDFPSPGMTQIAPTETCPGGNTYTVVVYKRMPSVIGTFCRNGTITQIQGLYKGRVTLPVPKNEKPATSPVKVSVGPTTKMLAVVKAELPRGQSYADFFSANYQHGFPSNEAMRWDLVVPPKHDFTVSTLAQTEPTCGSGQSVQLKYEQEGQEPIVTGLTDPQPTGKQGSFGLVLKNCDATRGSTPLTLNFRVSALRGGVPHGCPVKMQQGITLNIENTNAKSYCEMKMDGALQEKISVPPTTQSMLSFLDCPSEDLVITVSKTLECQQLASCSVQQTALSIPTLEACLPAPVRDVVWHLQVPEHGTVELMSPSVSGLRQSLPGDECGGERFALQVTERLALQVAESDGTPLGEFCSGGVIRKVQIHSSVTVTATAANARRVRSGQPSLFNVTFGPEIKESIVYHVRPEPLSQAPVLLATPAWPLPMKPSGTASWIVTLPSQYRADLLFTNVTQPKCQTLHTGIKVRHPAQVYVTDRDQVSNSPHLLFTNVTQPKCQTLHTAIKVRHLTQPKCQTLHTAIKVRHRPRSSVKLSTPPLRYVTQPKCQTLHTAIKVQVMGSEEEMVYVREDQELVDKVSVPGSFYLNMSNCQPESGGFSAMSKVMLEKKNKMLLGIILGVLGALVLLTVLVLAIVCLVTKKRKKHALANRISIYNPKGAVFRPPTEDSFKNDNGAHIYDAIDDAMTYSHLMGDSGYNGGGGGDSGVYRPFGTGGVDVKPPVISEVDAGNGGKKEEFSTFLDPADSFGPPRPRTPLGPMNSLGFEDRRMVDNTLYTFKNAGGEPNPIRLSDMDTIPPPAPVHIDDDEEWDNDYDDEDVM